MFTIVYKNGFINGYCNKKECTAIIGGIQKKHKTIMGAKRWITAALKDPLKHYLLHVLEK